MSVGTRASSSVRPWHCLGHLHCICIHTHGIHMRGIHMRGIHMHGIRIRIRVNTTLYHIPTMHGLTLSRLLIHMEQTITPYCLLNPIHTTTVLCLLIHQTYQLSKMVHACYAFT